jgi:hypothetical protein
VECGPSLNFEPGYLFVKFVPCKKSILLYNAFRICPTLIIPRFQSILLVESLSKTFIIIRIHFIRIRIQHFRLNTNPDPIQIQGSRKLRKKITAEKKKIFLDEKLQFTVSLGLHKVHPSYRRSLQISTEAIQHFKT